MNQPVLCPVCGQSQPVEKVSTLYLTGIGLSEKSATQPVSGKPNPGSAALSRKLAPPSGSRQAFTRPIHPDQAVTAFSLVVPIFLYGIFTSQQVLFLPVLGVLALFYGIYFWQRKRLLARFEQDQASRRAANERIKRGVERWMLLYYCSADEIVFEPGKDEPVLVDGMSGYLLQGR